MPGGESPQRGWITAEACENSACVEVNLDDPDVVEIRGTEDPDKVLPVSPGAFAVLQERITDNPDLVDAQNLPPTFTPVDQL